MNFNEMYTELETLIKMEIFEENVQEKFMTKYQNEIDTLQSLNSLNDYEQEDKILILEILNLFYRIGQPLISDEKYDKLYNEVSDEIQKEISFDPNLDQWEKIKHKIPMGSLSKMTNLEEIEKWNVKDEIYNKPKLISEKLDGISLSVEYKDGKFIRAVTRGDGKEGDDITENAKYFDGMVKKLSLPLDCVVRGEVIITHENFEEINKILKENGKRTLKNPRNGVAGLATSFKNRNIDILGKISFLAYEIKVFESTEEKLKEK